MLQTHKRDMRIERNKRKEQTCWMTKNILFTKDFPFHTNSIIFLMNTSISSLPLFIWPMAKPQDVIMLSPVGAPPTLFNVIFIILYIFLNHSFCWHFITQCRLCCKFSFWAWDTFQSEKRCTSIYSTSLLLKPVVED